MFDVVDYQRYKHLGLPNVTSLLFKNTTAKCRAYYYNVFVLINSKFLVNKNSHSQLERVKIDKFN